MTWKFHGAFIRALALAPLLAFGQAAPPVPTDPGFVQSLFDAIHGRQWVVVAGFVVSGVVWALRTWGAKLVPWFATSRGGAVLVTVVGVLGAIAISLLAGKLSWASILDGVLLALLSAGGYAVAKNAVTNPPPAS
jgi:hypothetical protein